MLISDRACEPILVESTLLRCVITRSKASSKRRRMLPGDPNASLQQVKFSFFLENTVFKSSKPNASQDSQPKDGERSKIKVLIIRDEIEAEE